MKKLTKLLSIILVLVMVVTMVPAINTSAATKKVKSKVTYTLKNGVLTIKGKGKMPKSMTFEEDDRIKKVVIKKGVTSISDYAFYKCVNLEKVEIANTVKEIGINCFSVTGLETIIIPSSVETIGTGSFNRCVNLFAITIPGDFKVKKGNKKSYTEGIMDKNTIKEVYFNSSFNPRIASYLQGQNWYTWEKDSKFKSINGVIYTIDGKDIVRVPYRKLLVVEEGCENLNLWAIGYKMIGDSRDDWCLADELYKIVIPESVKNVNVTKYADKSTIRDFTAMRDVTVYTTQLDSESIITIMSEFDFGYVDSEPALNITYYEKRFPNRIAKNGDWYTLDENVLLKYAGSKESITIPSYITTIAPRLYLNRDIKEVIIPNTVTTLMSQAFRGLSVEKITIPESVTNIGTAIFEGAEIKEVIIPENWTTIPDKTFWYCNKLEKINVPKSLTSIGEYAFFNTKVDPQPFLDNKNLRIIKKGAFENTNWNKLVIPKYINKIEERAFSTFSKKRANVSVKGNINRFSKNAFSEVSNQYYNLRIDLKLNSKVKDYRTYLSIKNMYYKNKKTRIKIQWAKIQDVDGYDIRLGTNKKITKDVKKIDIKKNTFYKDIKVNKKIKNVYVKIRPYKKVKGKKVYGKWATDNFAK